MLKGDAFRIADSRVSLPSTIHEVRRSLRRMRALRFCNWHDRTLLRWRIRVRPRGFHFRETGGRHRRYGSRTTSSYSHVLLHSRWPKFCERVGHSQYFHAYRCNHRIQISWRGHPLVYTSCNTPRSDTHRLRASSSQSTGTRPHATRASQSRNTPPGRPFR
jgi:hypothetical protein